MSTNTTTRIEAQEEPVEVVPPRAVVDMLGEPGPGPATASTRGAECEDAQLVRGRAEGHGRE